MTLSGPVINTEPTPKPICSTAPQEREHGMAGLAVFPVGLQVYTTSWIDIYTHTHTHTHTHTKR